MSGRNNVNSTLGGLEAFIDLTDTPKTYSGSELQYCQVNATGTGLQFAPASGTGITRFTELTDCPNSYTGFNNQLVSVNPGATGLNFVPNGTGITQFIQCTDTPMTYTGTSTFDLVNINGSHNGVEFTSLPTMSSYILPLEKLSNTPANNPPAGYYLASTGSGEWIGAPPHANLEEYELDILDTFTNTVLIPANSTNTYLLDMSFITLNSGFTISTPNMFSPTYSSTYTFDWAYTFQNNNATGVIFPSRVQTLSIDLIIAPNTVVSNLITRTYPVNNMSMFPGYDTHTVTGTSTIMLSSSNNYEIRITYTTPVGLSGYYIKQAKDFNLFTRKQTYLINNIDYLSAGYGLNGQTLVSNGINGFTLQTPILNNTELIQLTDCPPNYGSTGQVLTSSGSSVVWGTLPSPPIPTNELIYHDIITRAQNVTFTTAFVNYLANVVVTENVGFTLMNLSNFSPSISGQYFLTANTTTQQQKQNAETTGTNEFIVQLYNADTFLPVYTLFDFFTNMTDIPQYPTAPLTNSYSTTQSVYLTAGTNYNTLFIYRNNNTNVNCNVNFDIPTTNLQLIQPDNVDPLSVNNIFERTVGAGVNINDNILVKSGGVEYKFNNIIGEPASLFNAYAINSIVLTLIDSVNFQNMYVSLPFIFCRIGNMVTFKMYKQGLNYPSINTLNNSQSYLLASTHIPSSIIPSSTQIDSMIIGLNNNWNNTGSVMYLTSSGQLSFRSGQNAISFFGGFNAAGQTVYLMDQTFTYFLT